MFKIIVYKSMLGNFYWNLVSKNGKKIAESIVLPHRQSCYKIVNPIAKKLGCKVKFVDIEQDYEE